MSCERNDKIWDAVLDKIREDELDEAVFAEMDLETCYEYLMTGEVPDSYDRITYRLYKA